MRTTGGLELIADFELPPLQPNKMIAPLNTRIAATVKTSHRNCTIYRIILNGPDEICGGGVREDISSSCIRNFRCIFPLRRRLASRLHNNLALHCPVMPSAMDAASKRIGPRGLGHKLHRLRLSFLDLG